MSGQSTLPDQLINTTPGGTSLAVLQPVDEGGDSIGELTVPSPGLRHDDSMDMDMDMDIEQKICSYFRATTNKLYCVADAYCCSC